LAKITGKLIKDDHIEYLIIDNSNVTCELHCEVYFIMFNIGDIIRIRAVKKNGKMIVMNHHSNILKFASFMDIYTYFNYQLSECLSNVSNSKHNVNNTNNDNEFISKFNYIYNIQ